MMNGSHVSTENDNDPVVRTRMTMKENLLLIHGLMALLLVKL